MNIEIENLTSVERRITVRIPWEAVEHELDEAYRGLQKRARVKGFRPGKVPRKVLEQYYKQTVEGEVVGRLVDEGYRKAVEEHALFPIDRPSLEAMPTVHSGEPLSFVAKVEVKPEVEPQSYLDLEVERKVRQVTDAEVEAELASLREKATVVEQIEDRNDAHAGDLAVIDFFGYVDGETFKGGKGINYTVELGSKRMIPGFEDQIVGMRIGDEKTFVLRFPPSEGPEEARDKDVEWKVELKELKRKIMPELDDELAKDLGEFDTLDELRASVRQNLSTREDAKSRRLLRSQVLEALIAANPVEVPSRMVDRQIDAMMQDALRFVQQQKDPRILAAIDRLRVEARPQAERQVRGMLLLEGVARLERLEVTEQEVEGRLGELSREHRIPVPQLRKQLRENDQLESIRYNLLQDKALDRVLEKARVTDRAVTAEELDAAIAAGSEDESGAEDPRAADDEQAPDEPSDDEHRGHDHPEGNS